MGVHPCRGSPLSWYVGYPAPLTSTLAGVNGDMAPSLLTTIECVVGTSPQVPPEDFFHTGVVLALHSQLNEQVHQIFVLMSARPLSEVDLQPSYLRGRILRGSQRWCLLGP